MSTIQCSWFTDVSAWSGAHWEAWDQLVNACTEASFFLDARSVRALFEAGGRHVYAVVWHHGAPNDPAQWVGVALVEDTLAESHQLEHHMASRSTWFKVLSRRLHGRKGVLRFPVRVMGSVLGSGGHAYRFKEGIPSAQRRQLVSDALTQSLRNHPGTSRPRVALVKDFPLHDADAGGRSGGRRWMPNWIDLEFDPVMRLPLDPSWRALEDYLASLRTKSRTKVKRILSCSESCSLEEWDLAMVTAHAQDLYDLYLQVYDEASFRLGSLLVEDLVAAKHRWGDDFKVQVIRHGDRLVAFQCGYVTRTTVEAFFVGFHRGLNRDLSLYQRMLVEFIRWGIEAGAREVVMGRTALDIKSSVGALPEHWYCSVHFKNPLLQYGARLAARQYWPRYERLKRPWKQDAYPMTHPPVTKDAWV